MGNATSRSSLGNLVLSPAHVRAYMAADAGYGQLRKSCVGTGPLTP